MNRNVKFSSMALAAMVACNYAAAKSDLPNIVFVLADDLGWNDVGYMGSDYHETPNIDRLASQSVVFTNAYAAAANSAPSRACLMSGMYTPRHGIYTVSPSDRGEKTKRKLIPIPNTEDLGADFVTMAEALSQSGYVCGHVGKWHLGDDADGTGPLGQGFELNVAGCRTGSPFSYFYPYQSKKGSHPGLESGTEGEYLTDRLTSEAVGFIEQAAEGDKPFFLYLAHHAVHTPLRAPEELVAKYKNKAKGEYHTNPVYAAMMESLDNSVGRICEALETLGIYDNTIIVFTSDNGGSEPVTDNFMLRGGKGMPYEGGIRVPLAIKWHGAGKEGRTCDEPVHGVDFYPTFLNLAGGAAASGLDGADISPLMEDKDNKLSDRDLFWHFPAYLQSYTNSGQDFRATPYTVMRSGKWKLIYFYETQDCELYDLSADEKETLNLASSERSVTKKLKKRLFKWLDEVEADIPTELNPDYIQSSFL